ncbi:trypsin-like peptidase domain-containing protein [Nonomuraea fuscirosea]|uniref:trypsin-like peptidase domain-containing protein n=1 Tax=Nonomuraea fuscirosea TaxID=1291556 RepID=UPI0034412B82
MRRTLVTTLITLTGAAPALPATADQPPAMPAALSADQPAEQMVEQVAEQVVAPIRPARPVWGAEASPLMRPGRAVRYWTPGKQAKATASDLPESLRSARRESAGPRNTVHGSPVAGKAVPGNAVPGKAVPGKAAPGDATPKSAAARHSVPSAKRITPGGDDNGYARVPRPYTGAPYSRISGRLFFVNAAGSGDSCSASVIRSASKLLIVTAAHCVYGVPEGSSTGRWHTSFAFVPAYDGRGAGVREREPYGRWGGRRAWKPDGYTGAGGGDWNSVYDIALIEVGKRDRTLQDAVGAFTPMLNQGGKHTITTTGYPGLLGRKPYDGRDQLWCLGRTRQAAGVSHAESMLSARSATGQAARAGRLETYNCHLFKGHSGGPWIIKGTGDLVGVLSAGKEDGEADGNSVANALNVEGYGAIVKQADPDGVYDALSVKLSGPARPVARGGSATVSATVTMRGLAAAAQVPVQLTFPAGLRPASTGGAACKSTGRNVACTIAAVHPGKPVRITARLDVADDAARRLPITARVTSTRLDPTQRDNTGTLRLHTRA